MPRRDSGETAPARRGVPGERSVSSPEGTCGDDGALSDDAARPGRRPACVDVPALPLQLLLRREPSWRGLPVAVVAKDEPQGRVLWVNEEARRERVLPGQRYAGSLALARELRAGVVPEEEIRRGVREVAARLRRFTPVVDASEEEPGVFRLDAAGLSHLHPDLRAWAGALREDLASAGFLACVAVGWTEFGTYAVARALAARLLPGSSARAAREREDARPAATTLVFADPGTEIRALRRVPLERLSVEPEVRDLLAKLGVHDVAAFLALPERGLGERFGATLARLHRLAAGEARDPLRPGPCEEPVRASVLLEHPETDGTRLLFVVKRILDPLLSRTAQRREAVAGVELRLRLENRTERTDALRPAAPTLDAAQLLELLRLRLEAAQLRSGVTELVLTVQGVPATAEQLVLFAERPKRDLAAADRALARLRAEFGEDSVVRAALRDAHLPEASFAWEPLDHVKLPRPRVTSRPPLVRRLLAQPAALPPRNRHEPDGWMLRGLEFGNVVRIDGPYVVSGGWWGGEEVRREYHFAETSRGPACWIYYDVRRGRWFLQAEVR